MSAESSRQRGKPGISLFYSENSRVNFLERFVFCRVCRVAAMIPRKGA